jgi:hypothetical protein
MSTSIGIFLAASSKNPDFFVCKAVKHSSKVYSYSVAVSKKGKRKSHRLSFNGVKKPYYFYNWKIFISILFAKESPKL